MGLGPAMTSFNLTSLKPSPQIHTHSGEWGLGLQYTNAEGAPLSPQQRHTGRLCTTFAISCESHMISNVFFLKDDTPSPTTAWPLWFILEGSWQALPPSRVWGNYSLGWMPAWHGPDSPSLFSGLSSVPSLQMAAGRCPVLSSPGFLKGTDFRLFHSSAHSRFPQKAFPPVVQCCRPGSACLHSAADPVQEAGTGITHRRAFTEHVSSQENMLVCK